ncbi:MULTISPECIES: co-chaperone GroES [Lactobacillus]|uniref:Co-chaperonin GroES n=1 Tax=Lactobacillus xujianguonis TaxID=2495899 RepID=A0A437SWU2_9LACO|nr:MULTISPECIES: co-chaperone GroES [Lactobacillus]RVU71372.1 co-chaperone GroES [Lactobacillus xujianguonis]RVU76967.1 co-chaperone GroES [Lactobacillus xujianguonis]
MLEPIGDRVIVKVKEEEKTVGGIVLASNAKEKPTEGEVVAVGNGAYADNGEKLPMTVKKGDVVLYDKYSGTNVKYEGEKYLVLHEKDILAIVK